MASPFAGRTEVVGIWCQLLPVMRQREVQRTLKDIICLVGSGLCMCVRGRREAWAISDIAHSGHVE